MLVCTFFLCIFVPVNIYNNLKDIKLSAYAYPDEYIQHGGVDELEKMHIFDFMDKKW